MGRSSGAAVSETSKVLLSHYQELEDLSQHALTSLKNGLDLHALGPIFERKAALNALISQTAMVEPQADSRALKALLEAQARATRAESELAQLLQVFVSSYGTNQALPRSDSGKKWDVKG